MARGETSAATRDRWVGWLLLALPTFAAGGPLLGVGPIFAFRIAVAALIGLAAWDWALGRASRPYRSRTSQLLVALIVCFGLAAAMSAIVSRPRLAPAVIELIALGLMLFGALALAQLWRGRASLLALLRGWLIALALVQLEAMAEILTPLRLPNFFQPDPTHPDWFLVAGPFHNPNQLAAFLLTGLLVLPIGFALEERERRWLRWAYVAVAVPMPIVVYNTGSILVMMLLLPAAGVWLLFNRRTWPVVPALLVLLAVLPIGRAALAKGWDSVNYILSTYEMQGYTSSIRLNLVQNGFWMLWDSHLLGKGPGSFPDQMASGRPPYDAFHIVNPHSGVIEIIAQYGILGALAWLGALVALVVSASRVIRATRGGAWISAERALALWVLVTVLLWPALSLANSSWLIQSASVLQAMTVALLARELESTARAAAAE